VLLGKERSVIIQYSVCLTLAVLAFSLQGILLTYGGNQVQQALSNTAFLDNPIIAAFYLAIPYIVMIAIDVRSRRKRKKREEQLEFLTTKKPNDAIY
jgi:membrane protein DedA with SNARE-associated domain